MLETVLYYVSVEPRLVELKPSLNALLLLGMTAINIIFTVGYIEVLAVYLIGTICPKLLWANPFLLIRALGTVVFYTSYGLLTIPKRLFKARRANTPCDTSSSLSQLEVVQQ